MNTASEYGGQGGGISPEFYATLGLGLDTRQGVAYAGVQRLIEKYCSGAQRAIDHGSGAGRSTRFLKELGLKEVVGVDVNEDMLKKAMERQIPGTSYRLISSGTLPFKEESFDLAFSGIVFVEIPTGEEMRNVLTELKRVTKKEGMVMILTCTKAGYITDSDAFRCLLSEDEKKNLKDGDVVPTGIRGSDQVFTDYFWSDAFYKRMLKEVGLALVETHMPVAEGMPSSEACYVIYVCKKA